MRSAEKPLTMYIIDNACYGKEGLSGGDRIFIELARRWAQTGIRIHIIASLDGYNICQRENLRHDNITYTVWWKQGVPNALLVPFSYVARTFTGVFKAWRMKSPEGENAIIYSASDFWPDSIPALVMKLRNRRAKWVAGFYMFTPPPWQKNSMFRNRYMWRGLLSYIGQIPVYRLIRRYADMVFVTSEPDVARFAGDRLGCGNVVVIRGGVDTQLPLQVPEPKEKTYDAVFIGRFHPQKGVLELVDIWKLVCGQKKSARLAMIGLGPLERQLQEKIAAGRLQDNISIMGYQDGIPKIKTFKASRMVLHPAVYDSGGMAACEAMSCGLPGISFDLEALKTYYPKGMIKTTPGDLAGFAANIIRLLNDKDLYDRTRREALDWAQEWDWEQRARDILVSLTGARQPEGKGAA
ncbi:glycosyltransferase family 4 protein [Chloroflexota bacterium]